MFVADVNNQKTKNIIFFVFFDFLPKTIKSYSYLDINFFKRGNIVTNSNRTYKSWRLNTRPSGEIKNSDLELVDDVIPEISKNEILVRTIYFSLDPTNRIWMSDVDQYMEPVEIGDIMRAGGSCLLYTSPSPRD